MAVFDTVSRAQAADFQLRGEAFHSAGEGFRHSVLRVVWKFEDCQLSNLPCCAALGELLDEETVTKPCGEAHWYELERRTTQGTLVST